MAVISLMTTKGGGGKTTSALILATVLAEQGASVALVDADPNQPLVRFSNRAKLHYPLTVRGNVTQDDIIEVIEELSESHQFVIVDIEGSANLTAGYALTSSDLVLIPLQPSELDVTEATKTLNFILRQEKQLRRDIHTKVFWARKPAGFITRTSREIYDQFEEAGIGLMANALIDREAYRIMFGFGQSLDQMLTEHVSSLDKAKSNAAEWVVEVIELLKQGKAPK